jgi:hypothetical protein
LDFQSLVVPVSYRLNPFLGNLDIAGLSLGLADTRYLKLDCSNDPLTGNLSLGNYLLSAGNYDTAATTTGDEKITNGTFTTDTTGWTLGGTNIWFWGHVFTVSGISTTPTAGSTYTNNGVTFTTRYTSITGTAPNKSGYMVMSCTTNNYPLAAPGTLTKASGTGDASVAYSAVSSDKVFHGASSTATLSQASASMVTPLVVDEYYLLSFTISNFTVASTGIVASCGGTTMPAISSTSSTGTHTFLFRATSDAALTFTPASTSRFCIDSVSLKQVTGNIVGTGNLLLTGTVGSGTSTPYYGAGTRLMWIPSKAAFRAGYASAAGDWNDDNIGNYSLAGGSGNKVSADYGTAFGNGNTVSAQSGFAVGSNNQVLESSSGSDGATFGVAMGISNFLGDGSSESTSGQYGIGLGQGNYIYGSSQVALGTGNTLPLGASYACSVGGVTMTADAIYAVNLGNVNVISQAYGTTIGFTNEVTINGLYGTVIGSNSIVDAEAGIALGYFVKSSGYSAICMGRNDGSIGDLDSNGYGSIVMGYNIGTATMKATNDFSFAGGGTIEEGSTLLSSGPGSFVYGFAGDSDLEVAGTLSASGRIGVAIGWNVQSSGDYNFCYGHSFADSTASSFNLGWGQRDFQVKAGQTTFGSGAAGQDYTCTFTGETNSGEFKWMEDENYFRFANTILTIGQFIADSDSNGITLGDDQDISLYSNGAGTLWIFPNAADTDTTVNFYGTTNSGQFKWMEDENYFQYADDILMDSTKMIQFRDTAIHIKSIDDGHLDLTADTQIDLNGPTLATDKILFTQTDGNEYIDSLADGYLDLGATTSIRTGANLDHGAHASSWETMTAPTTAATTCFVYAKDYLSGPDAYTVLLLHCDGADGSTTFTDSSSSAKSVTANGNAQIDTAQSKFGGASGLFDGTTDYLTLADSSDWAFGTGDFTIDFWVRFNGDSANDMRILRQFVDTDNYWEIHKTAGTSSGDFYFFYRNAAATKAYYKYTWDPSANTWYHIALVRNGTNFYLFLDGVLTSWTTVTTAISTNDLGDIGAGTLYIGASSDASKSLNGWLDEFRISKGIARWTSGFSVPTEAYGTAVAANLYQKDGAGNEWLVGNVRGPASVADNQIVRFDGTGGKTLQAGTPTIDDNGDLHLVADNDKVFFGAGDDATITYDGTNLLIDPRVVGTGYLGIAGDTRIVSDTYAFFVGGGSDMKMYYDGTNGNIDTDLVAASDLTIDCGTAKTVVLEVPVYDDANVGALVLRTGGTAPGVVQLKDNDGDDTGIYTVGFAVGEEGSGVIEIPHDYKEGTDIVFHIHWGANDAPAGGTDNVKWQLTYSIARGSNTFPDSITPAAVEVAYTTQYQYLFTDLATITGSTGGVDGGNIKIGDQFHFTVKRIAASADEFGGEALMGTLGFHYQKDTLGSRSISAK